ncbi:helix-turn-helix domain-containing protein [Streptomyces benahoarensis]|uniref:Helix-turn-helix domain-containing protein n=1 Tax=Streptomyces benahoarensis TaxID=2595054 RepID=A0A553YYF4_9ACTN|nr:helix-turn-helix transcriptional regulator [Streptomyces benahoarensis]TSB17897.1 helix-turn-helix domain-containing protein [Streptomyces benahoarensis]TSB34221.1 helix-turn-helix domain-containing protein [Streptomyces benahoarensis]
MAGNTGGGEPESTDSLRAFGAAVKVLRERAGLTQEQMAPLVGFSVQMVASIEQGRRFPPPDFIERAEEVLNAHGVLRAMAPHLARKPGLAAWFRQWAALEEKALSLYTYECRLIPGLLQTEAYAQALFHNHLPPQSDQQISDNMAARLERQRLLTERPNTAYSFILEEHLFLRGLGGASVTRELIDHIIEIASQRNVEVQIMPQVRESHAGLAGPMRLAETAGGKWYAYCEGQEYGQFISDPKVVSMLQMRYARMRSQALSLDDSLSLLQRMRGAL